MDHFDQLDTNHDGRLAGQELPSSWWVESADADGDGALTRREIMTWIRARRAQATDHSDQAPAGVEGALFRQTHVHSYGAAQATALCDLFDNGILDLVVVCKRHVHVLSNDGHSQYTHHATLRADRANGFGMHDFNAGSTSATCRWTESSASTSLMHAGTKKFPRIRWNLQ